MGHPQHGLLRKDQYDSQQRCSKQADISVDAEATGWRHGATWTYLVMLAASAVALFVSFMLSADTLKLARNPGSKLGCDVNAVVSCSTVAESWQAEIVKFAGLSFPNAFFGIAAESVFVTIAVIGLAKVAVPRWFAHLHMAGRARRVGVFVLADHAVAVRDPRPVPVVPGPDVRHDDPVHGVVARYGERAGMPAKSSGLRKYYRLNFDLMVDVVWIVALIVLIIVKDGPIFA